MTAGVNDFDLDRSTAQSWTEFAARLGEVVAHMDPGATLTIGSLASETPGRSPFVTFTCDAQRHICAQASANGALSTDFQLSAEQLSRLADLGWQPPGAGEDPAANHVRCAAQEESATLAAAVTAVLRDVFAVPHPAFLAPDQLAEILTPPALHEAAGTGFAPDDLVAVPIGGHRQLDLLVAAELAQILGYPPMRDADGDFALRVGSTMVFVRCTADAKEVLVFSVLVHEVEGRSRAMEVISDLNTESRFVRFLLIRDRVFVSLSVFAQPFVPAHLQQALSTVSVVADQLDEHLAAKLRGRTTFPETPS